MTQASRQMGVKMIYILEMLTGRQAGSTMRTSGMGFRKISIPIKEMSFTRISLEKNQTFLRGCWPFSTEGS